MNKIYGFLSVAFIALNINAGRIQLRDWNVC